MASDTRIEFTFLNEPDLIESGVLDMQQCVETIDSMFHLVGQGDYIMGGADGTDHGLAIKFPTSPTFPGMPADAPDRRFMSLVSYLGGDFHICGEKWYGSNIENRARNLPRSILTVTLNDPETGAPLALMSGNLISAMRTGAVPGVACTYLAPKGATTVGAVGGGVINRTCLKAITTACPTVDNVLLYDIDPEKGRSTAKGLAEELGLAVTAVETLRDCVEPSDVLTVAASGVNLPEIDRSWVKPGSLITLTGDAKFTGNFYRSTRIVADMWAMHRNWIVEDRHGLVAGVDSAPDTDRAQGLETLHPDLFVSRNIVDLGDVVTGEAVGRVNEEDPIIMLSGGLPMEDAAWASRVYRNARERGIGQTLALWDSPAMA